VGGDAASGRTQGRIGDNPARFSWSDLRHHAERSTVSRAQAAGERAECPAAAARRRAALRRDAEAARADELRSLFFLLHLRLRLRHCFGRSLASLQRSVEDEDAVINSEARRDAFWIHVNIPVATSSGVSNRTMISLAVSDRLMEGLIIREH
jgi:hypothetical protein